MMSRCSRPRLSSGSAFVAAPCAITPTVSAAVITGTRTGFTHASGLLPLDATTLPNHTAGMNHTEKIAVSLPRGIADRARRAVRQGRAPSVSAYKLAALLDEMLAETGGPLTAAERRAADRALGVSAKPQRRT